MEYINTIDHDYPADARYPYYINRSFNGKQKDDLIWMYTRMHLIDDVIDSKGIPEDRIRMAEQLLLETIESDEYKNMETTYGIKRENIIEMTDVLKEMAMWDCDISPFTNYDELEVFNYRLMSQVARCVSPIIFYDIIKNNHNIRQYFDVCFTEHMMAMQIINLVKDITEDSHNGQHFFPQDYIENGELTKGKKQFMNGKGDIFLKRGNMLKHKDISGEAGADFVAGLTHIYNSLFMLQLLV